MQSPPQLTDLISRRPLLILSLSIILTLLLATGIPKLTMRPFLEDDLPPSDPILAASEKYAAVFGEDDFAYLALVGDTIYRPSTLAKVAAITDELNALDHVLADETLSLATVRRVRWRDWGLDVRKYLSPLPQTP